MKRITSHKMSQKTGMFKLNKITVPNPIFFQFEASDLQHTFPYSSLDLPKYMEALNK